MNRARGTERDEHELTNKEITSREERRTERDDSTSILFSTLALSNLSIFVLSLMLVIYFLIERALKVLDVEDEDWLLGVMFSWEMDSLQSLFDCSLISAIHF
jgi:hypothetical protein